MAVPFSNSKLRVPKGFQNLLEGFAREVLREQPADVNQFGAIYFERLLKIREGGGPDPAADGAKIEDRFYNNNSFKEKPVDPSDPVQQDAAVKIQTKYRGHAAELEVDKMRQDEAATTIQAGIRGHMDRKRVNEISETATTKTSKGEPAPAAAAPAGEEEEEMPNLEDPDVQQAATMIQAGFRGMQTRKDMKASETSKPAAPEATPADEAAVPDIIVPTALEDESTAGPVDDGTPAVDLPSDDTSPDPPVLRKSAGGVAPPSPEPEVEVSAPEAEESAPAAEAEAPEEEEELPDLNDPDVVQATAQIQAGFKGLMARKKVAKEQTITEEVKGGGDAPPQDLAPTEEPAQPDATPAALPEEEEEMPNLDDPEIMKAATTIQAGFRGYKTRRDVTKKEGGQTSAEGSAAPDTGAAGSEQPVVDGVQPDELAEQPSESVEQSSESAEQPTGE